MPHLRLFAHFCGGISNAGDFDDHLLSIVTIESPIDFRRVVPLGRPFSGSVSTVENYRRGYGGCPAGRLFQTRILFNDGGNWGLTSSFGKSLRSVRQLSMTRSNRGTGECLQRASLDRGTIRRLCEAHPTRAASGDVPGSYHGWRILPVRWPVHDDYHILPSKRSIRDAPRFRLVWCRVAAHAACPH